VLRNIPLNAGDVLQLLVTNTSTSGDFVGINFAVAFPLVDDINRDGHVNAADILAMMQALVDLPDYRIAKGLTDPNLFKLVADVNGDGAVNNADLQALLNLLKSGGGSVAAVPEPASIALIALAAPLLASCRTHSRRQVRARFTGW
jgi:hypothetical protein